jgi:hypothetical protein
MLLGAGVLRGFRGTKYYEYPEILNVPRWMLLQFLDKIFN